MIISPGVAIGVYTAERVPMMILASPLAASCQALRRSPSESGSTFRSDCKIHTLRQHLFLQTLGFTKNDDILSTMVREGMISRQEAMHRIERENIVPEEYLVEILDELKSDFSDLKSALERYRSKSC